MSLELSPTAQNMHGPLGGSILLLDCVKGFCKRVREDAVVRIWVIYFFILFITFAITEWFPSMHESRLPCSELSPVDGFMSESLVDESIYSNSTEVVRYSWDISTWFKVETKLYDPEDNLRYRIKLKKGKLRITDKVCDVINADSAANFSNINPNMFCVDTALEGKKGFGSHKRVGFRIYKPEFPSLSITGSFQYERYFFPYDESALEFYVGKHTFRFTASRSDWYLSRTNFEYGYLVSDQVNTSPGNENGTIRLGWPGAFSGVAGFICGSKSSSESLSSNETADQAKEALYAPLFNNATMANLTSLEAASLLQDVLVNNDMHATILFIAMTQVKAFGANGLQFALLMLSIVIIIALYLIPFQVTSCTQPRTVSELDRHHILELESMVQQVHNQMEQNLERGQNANAESNQDAVAEESRQHSNAI